MTAIEAASRATDHITDEELKVAELDLVTRCEDESRDHLYRLDEEQKAEWEAASGGSPFAVWALGFALTGEDQRDRKLLADLVFCTSQTAIHTRANYAPVRWARRPAIFREGEKVIARMELTPLHV